jgi:diacylglycerol kinase (ATP)
VTPVDVTGYLVVANANAGTAEQQIVGEACEALASEGAEVERAETASIDDLDGVIDVLGEQTLVVAGGDGSVHAVVDRLWHRGQLGEVGIGLIPLGTGNDLARGAGIPLTVGDAAELIRTGSTRPTDLIVTDDGTAIVNAAHVGLGAEAAEVSTELKDRLGPLAYPIGALVAGVRERGWGLRVTVDGRDVTGPEQRVLLIGIGNGGTIGGGTPLFPDADVGDGLLDVVVAAATGPAARVAFGAALRKGEHVDREDVLTVRGAEVRVSGEAVRHNVDGEVTDEISDRAYRVEPGAWQLIRPG